MMYSYSNSTETTYREALQPTNTDKGATKNQQIRVPRPRNAFMIFRSAFWADAKIARSVEHDHRHISRIIGHCWNKMSEAEKDVWRCKADQEKIEHELKHPGYRFCPNPRTKKPIRRKVKRNGADDLLRCERVAELLLAGKQGKELTDAVSYLPPPAPKQLESSSPPECEEPPFRSPLLPPLTLEEETWNSPSSSPSSTPTDEYFSSMHLHTFEPLPEYGYPHQNFPVNNTEHIVFETKPVAPLAYSLYRSQISSPHTGRGYDLHLESIHHSRNRFSYDPYPRSVVSFYNPFAICDSEPLPPLPGPISEATVMSEPVQWNAEFQYSS